MRKLFAITFAAAAFTFAACESKTGETAENAADSVATTEEVTPSEPETVEATATPDSVEAAPAGDSTQAE